MAETARIANPARFRQGRWLPLAVSLGLHALFLPFLFYAASKSAPSSAGAIPDSRVWETELRLTLSEAGMPRPRQAESPGSDEEEENTPPTFKLVPVDVTPTPVPNPCAVAPAVVQEKQEPEPHAGATLPPGGTGTGGNAGNGSGTATVTLFQATAQARTVVYVIDRSLSMGLPCVGCSSPLDAAKRELLASLSRLPSSTRFQVILYNRCADRMRLANSYGLVPASDENRSAVAQLLERLPADGATDHVAALRESLALQPDAIFFVTDGDNLTPEQVRAVTLQNHGRTAIHAVDVGNRGSPAADRPLSLLAQTNGGTYSAATGK
jgi:hypothetical protein